MIERKQVLPIAAAAVLIVAASYKWKHRTNILGTGVYMLLMRVVFI